ncbi:acyl--CoA ligase [Desulfallas sp. Bu1-1]|uniref:class I adenylate-forming enzyme family protein n=1 Tax=Desulfallas sp. Bu1-1 TaxID=2787620 RepID=UPI00189DFA58|nr:class I adenylate-forming enzyme family protein [Desulfallas sp. Bu1-1]MBF7082847.1 acyl--CoA ligase [Desulfallas sp. Bu1-1]
MSLSRVGTYVNGILHQKSAIYRERRLTESFWSGETHNILYYTTIPFWLRKNAFEVPDRLALVEGIPDASKRRTWTYAELLRDAERIAYALLNKYNPGDRIAIMAPNVVEWALMQYGIAIAGMIRVTLNPAYHAREIEHILKTAEVAAVFTMKNYRGNKMIDTIKSIRESLPTLQDVYDLEELDDFINTGKPVKLPEVKPEDIDVIMFTSGTTGNPKGAMLNHFGMTNSVRFMAQRAGLENGGVWINVMPLFFMGGNGFASLGTLQQQATHVLVIEFDVPLFLSLMEEYKGTFSLLVPTMMEAILAYPDLKKYDLSSWKYVLSGASKVEADLVRRFKKVLGCDISIVCGQTEAHGGYTQTHRDDSPEDQAETIGQPYPMIDFKIADGETGAVLPIGEEGEICIRGYQVMRGYYNNPASTAEAIDEEGWLHSGDLGVMDERGFVRFTGRLKDMIIRGGVNIYPAEVENLLKEHPKVDKVAVVGVPDEYWGEQVAALIIPKSFDDLPSIEELDAFCLNNLARFKRPRFYAFVKEFPMTGTGKLRKFKLKEDIVNGVLKLKPVQSGQKE